MEDSTSTNEGFEESRSRGARTKDSRSQEAEELVRRIQAVEKAHGSGALGSEEHVGMAQGFKKLVSTYKGSGDSRIQRMVGRIPAPF